MWRKELFYLISLLPIFCENQTEEHNYWREEFYKIDSEEGYIRILRELERFIHKPLSFFRNIFGPLAGEWIYAKISHDIPVGMDKQAILAALDYPPSYFGSSNPMFNDIKKTSKAIISQFGLNDIGYSLSSRPEWIRGQLTEIRIGLSTLAAVLGVPDERVGRQSLKFFLHEGLSGEKDGRTFVVDDTLVVQRKGGRVARAWAEWAGEKMPDDIADLFFDWLDNQPCSPASSVMRQHCTLLMAQKEFKRLVDSVDFVSDQGEKAARRYRAFGKWVDDVKKGASLSAVLQGWTKLKTGNKIAWSAHDFGPNFLKMWRQNERNIETLFWGGASWRNPAWVGQRSTSGRSRDSFHFLLGVGFESFVRSKIGYDSWNAQESPLHPIEDEARDFYIFLRSIFGWI